MSDHHQAGPLDKRTAERLLGGADGHARLHALLSAAAGPARPDELAGEDAAVAAFRAAPRPAPASRGSALRRFLTIKVLAVVGGSLILTGGAAYATMTGRLPGQDPAPSPSPTVEDGRGGRDSAPNTQFSPTAPPSTPRPTTSPSPGNSKKHGKSNAPGQQKKSKRPKKTGPPRNVVPPRIPVTPPRVPGRNGTPPTGLPRGGTIGPGAPSETNSGSGHGSGRPG